MIWTYCKRVAYENSNYTKTFPTNHQRGVGEFERDREGVFVLFTFRFKYQQTWHHPESLSRAAAGATVASAESNAGSDSVWQLQAGPQALIYICWIEAGFELGKQSRRFESVCILMHRGGGSASAAVVTWLNQLVTHPPAQWLQKRETLCQSFMAFLEDVSAAQRHRTLLFPQLLCVFRGRAWRRVQVGWRWGDPYGLWALSSNAFWQVTMEALCELYIAKKLCSDFFLAQQC